jgi:defect in organelle trafficking protein DotD
MRASIAAVALIMLSLGGCASTIPVPTTVETQGMPNPELALRSNMQHVDAEMAELGTMRIASVPMAANAAPVVPEDLQRVVNFTWAGSLDQGVAKLAQSIGYTFYRTAPPGAPAIQVAVQVQNVPVFDAFKALGEEAGTRATVQVDPLHHQVQVIHHA